MDDFAKSIRDRVKAREETIKQRQLEISTKRSAPLTACDNIPLTSKNEKKPNLSQQAQPNVSNRLKKLVAMRKQWEAEERGEDVNYDEVPTPKRNEIPKDKDVKVVNFKRKDKLLALSSKYKNLDEDEDSWFPSLDEDPVSQNSKTDVGNKKAEILARNQIQQKMVSQILDLQPETEPVVEIRPTPTKRTSLGRERSDLDAKRLKESSESIEKRFNPASMVTIHNHEVTSSHINTSSSCETSQVEDEEISLNSSKNVEDEDKSLNETSESLEVESSRPEETSIDTSIQMDTSQQVDTSILDTSVLDTSIVDTSVLDTSVSDTSHQMDPAPGVQSELDRKISRADDVTNESLVDKMASFEVTSSGSEQGASFEFSDTELQDDDVIEDEQQYDDFIDEIFDFNDSAKIENNQKSEIILNKSRQQICEELEEKRQISNEAEDTIIRRRSTRREVLSPRLRSTSLESNLSLHLEEQTPVVTIDAYRSENKNTSIAAISNQPKMKEIQKVSVSHKKSFKEKLQELNSAICRQMEIIKQTSDALNCCYDEEHGKGSVTELEAQKLLLTTTHTRLALLEELKNLKTNGPEKYRERIENDKMSLGSICIRRLALPVRTEYLFSMANKKDGGEARHHYYLLLIKCGSKVFTTHLASTSNDLNADSLIFKSDFHLNDLKSDYETIIEVYSVNQQLSNEGGNLDKSKGKFSVFNKKLLDQQHQLNNSLVVEGAEDSPASNNLTFAVNNSNYLQASTVSLKSLTPRKFRSRSTHSSTSSSMIPPSPGGPTAIRSSSFALIGRCCITKSDVNETSFELSNVPFLSPLVGQLKCEISSTYNSPTERRGFLTMFEDVGGLGAWRRRWCVLRCGELFCWQYPDDENTQKQPLDSIHLCRCRSDVVKPVDRIKCARPNVLEFVSERRRRKNDKDTLITNIHGSFVTIKHWLAADSKQERDFWISDINTSLSDVREWKLDALKPNL